MSIRRKRKSEGMLQEDAKIVVGIDFGTTFSGFAYALKKYPDKVYTFYEWPRGAKAYCKTQTSLWYSETCELQGWGWPAYVSHKRAVEATYAKAKGYTTGSSSASRRSLFSTTGHFFTKFKLFLAANGSDSGPEPVSETLPEGFSVEGPISDDLQQLSIFIMAELENKFGGYTLKKDVQWCLTVAPIWDDAAKQTMLKCSQLAGLVQDRHCTDKDASAHPLTIVLEPEAASVYCQLKLKESQFRRVANSLLWMQAEEKWIWLSMKRLMTLA